MVASEQVKNPALRGFERHRGRRLSALAEVIGRTTIPILCDDIFTIAKRVVVNLLEFDEPQIAEAVSVRRKIRTAAEKVGRQTLRKHLRGGSRKKAPHKFVPSKSGKQTSRWRQDFFTNFSHLSCQCSNHFRYQPFVALSGNPPGHYSVVEDVLSHP